MKEEVVVAGGGIAGLESALRLERKGFKVKLVDPEDGLFFYPSGHRIIDGDPAEEVTINYERKFQDRGIEHIKASVTDLDKEGKRVSTTSGKLDFDYLVLALGSEANFFGIETDETELMRYKEDLEEINDRIEKKDSLEAFVVGGGATGLEAAASLSERKNVDVIVLQAVNRLVPQLNEKTSEKALKILENKGVNINLNEAVEEIEDEEIKTSDSTYNADLIIWAAGIKKREFLNDLELSQNDKGLLVDEHQRIEGEENIFAVGDNCFYDGKKSRALYALFESKAAAKNIYRTENSKNLVERQIHYDPILLYMGKHSSILELKNFCFSGLIPSLIEKFGVEKRYMLLRKHIL
ncbi:MAG: FAD-dependent oxidoreductase [Candidatus Nanohaloarchaea archaeon]